jgi:alcohol dehydrogenase YqhD (iron-dependent ADH family)
LDDASEFINSLRSSFSCPGPGDDDNSVILYKVFSCLALFSYVVRQIRYSNSSIDSIITHELTWPISVCYQLQHASKLAPNKRKRHHEYDVVKVVHEGRAYIIASASLSRQTDYLQQLGTARGGYHAGTWIGVRSYTYWDELVPINDACEKQANILITLSESSIPNAAKAITYAIANGVSKIEDMRKILEPTTEDGASGVLERGVVGNDPELPLIFIPTSLSGGEYSMAADGTNAETHRKHQLRHLKIYASFVILDPQLTITTPFEIWI